MGDIFTQDIKDLLKLATTDFDKFYKETEKKASGVYSKAASSGVYSKAASSGNSSTAASSGNSSTAASSGAHSKAASSGDYSKAASSGENSACSALGYRSAVKGDLGNLLMASEYNEKNGKFIPIGGKADIVDGKKIKPNCWYIVENAKWVEVDFSDDIFLRVISTKGNIKKCKDDNERILYVVTDGTNNAHGDTIKEAQEALLFKTANRDVSAYKNMAMDTVKSPIEWAVIYSIVTGACEAGCRHFMDQRKLKDAYTLSEILEETKGAYNYSRFIEVVGGANE